MPDKFNASVKLEGASNNSGGPKELEFLRTTEKAFEELTAEDFIAANTLFKEALRIRPHDLQAIYNVASAEFLLGNDDIAEGYLKMAADGVSTVSDPQSVEEDHELAVQLAKARIRRRIKQQPTQGDEEQIAKPTTRLVRIPKHEWKTCFKCPWLQPDGSCLPLAKVKSSEVLSVRNLHTGNETIQSSSGDPKQDDKKPQTMTRIRGSVAAANRDTNGAGTPPAISPLLSSNPLPNKHPTIFKGSPKACAIPSLSMPPKPPDMKPLELTIGPGRGPPSLRPLSAKSKGTLAMGFTHKKKEFRCGINPSDILVDTATSCGTGYRGVQVKGREASITPRQRVRGSVAASMRRTGPGGPGADSLPLNATALGLGTTFGQERTQREQRPSSAGLRYRGRPSAHVAKIMGQTATARTSPPTLGS